MGGRDCTLVVCAPFMIPFNRGHFGTSNPAVFCVFVSYTKIVFPTRPGKIPRCGFFPPFSLFSTCTAVIIWGLRILANAEVLPPELRYSGAHRQFPKKRNSNLQTFSFAHSAGTAEVELATAFKLSCWVGWRPNKRKIYC